MERLSAFLMMLVAACLVAGIYGALHNQVSYTVGPDYFHFLKFPQFGIGEGMPPRLGAAQVGFLASWWMGVVIGLPLATLAMFVRGPVRAAWRAFRVAVILVLGLTAGLGLMSLGLPIPEEVGARIPVPEGAEAEGFRRAAMLHSASYLAGLMGLLGGLLVMIAAVWRSRRDP